MMKKSISLVLLCLAFSIAYGQYDLPPQDESFDPLKLAEPVLPFMDGTMIYEIITATEDSLSSHYFQRDSVQVVEKMGYKIQLFSSQDFFAADSIYGRAQRSFADYAVERVYNAPYYKIRVGNFINREDAEDLLDRAIHYGYRGSWIIRTKVRIKEINLPG